MAIIKSNSFKLAKRVADTNAALANLAKAEAGKSDNAKRKKDITDAVADLDKLLPQYIQASKDVAKNPRDANAVTKLEKLIDDLEKHIHKISEPEAASNAKHLEAELKALTDAAKKGDSKVSQHIRIV
jgi:ABC-type transporter Mla subunit MlaD